EPVIEVRRGVELSHQVRRQTATSNLSARAAAQFLLIPVPCGLCCCSCAIPMRDSGVKVKMFAPVVHALADLPERAIVGFDIEARRVLGVPISNPTIALSGRRSEEHTSELQSRFDLVCRLLLEKKKA